MSFYSYKNSGSTHCPCNLSGNEVFSGLNEKICIQVQRVYDSCLMQEQLKEQKVTPAQLRPRALLQRAVRRAAGKREHPADDADHL